MAQIVLIHGIGQQASTSRSRRPRGCPAWSRESWPAVTRMRQPWPRAWRPATDQNCPSLARMAFYGDLFLPTDTQGEEARASPEAEALAEALAAALLAHAAVSDDPRLAAEAANAVRQADPDREACKVWAPAPAAWLAVLDGNAWLTARIFGLLQKAGQTCCRSPDTLPRTTCAPPSRLG